MTHLICAVFSWYGIELDDPVGRHDGTVQGVRYFAATDNHGVFATESKLQKVHHQQAPPSSSKKAMATSKSLDILDSHRAASCSSPEQPLGHASPSNGQVSAEEKLTFSMNYHTLATNEDPSSTPGSTPGKPKARRPLRRSLSAQHRAIKVGHHTLTSPPLLQLLSGGQEGGPGPFPIFRATNESAFSTNAQSRFASVVLDRCPGTSALSATHLTGVLVSL